MTSGVSHPLAHG
jgi:hypothetical protein